MRSSATARRSTRWPAPGRGGAPVLVLERFDGTAWRDEGTIPGPGLNAPAAVALDGKIYLIGGFVTDTNLPERRRARLRHGDPHVERGGPAARAARRSRGGRARRPDSRAGRRQLEIDACRPRCLRSREERMDPPGALAAQRKAARRPWPSTASSTRSADAAVLPISAPSTSTIRPPTAGRRDRRSIRAAPPAPSCYCGAIHVFGGESQAQRTEPGRRTPAAARWRVGEAGRRCRRRATSPAPSSSATRSTSSAAARRPRPATHRSEAPSSSGSALPANRVRCAKLRGGPHATPPTGRRHAQAHRCRTRRRRASRGRAGAAIARRRSAAGPRHPRRVRHGGNRLRPAGPRRQLFVHGLRRDLRCAVHVRLLRAPAAPHPEHRGRAAGNHRRRAHVHGQGDSRASTSPTIRRSRASGAS